MKDEVIIISYTLEKEWKRICRMRFGEGEKKFALPFRKRGRVIAE